MSLLFGSTNPESTRPESAKPERALPDGSINKGLSLSKFYSGRFGGGTTNMENVNDKQQQMDNVMGNHARIVSNAK